MHTLNSHFFTYLLFKHIHRIFGSNDHVSKENDKNQVLNKSVAQTTHFQDEELITNFFITANDLKF